ncbi:MAG: ATP-binding protein [Cyanobacteria bacterium P01_E01_bin.42]
MFHRVIDYHPSLILPETPTKEVLELFKGEEWECLVVGRSRDRDDIIGLLTPARLLQHIATEKDWQNDSIEEIALGKFTIVPESALKDPIALCESLERSQISHLLLADEENRIIGILLAKNLNRFLEINREVEEAFVKRLETEIERQQLLQQKLHTSYTQTKAILGAMQDVVLVLDTETDNLKIELPNPNLSNESIANFLNQTIEQFYDISHSEFFLKKIKKSLVEQQTVEFEYTLFEGDLPVWFAARISPISQHSAIWIARNISERKRAEQDILKALKKEQELSQLKSGFITIASHEFRTPLTVIMAAAKLLNHYEVKLTRELNDQQLERLLRSSDRILRLLEDVLVLGKADAGKIEFNPTPVNLKIFCEELLAELRLSDEEQHDLIFIERGNVAQKVSIDEHLLHHVLSNLLSNAIKYSPAHSNVTLTLEVSDRHAIFQVCDRGIGIPPEDISHLFEAFHRAQNAHHIQGTGLGLAIVKRAVDLHSGTIAVESKVGVGTTFTVTTSF